MKELQIDYGVQLEQYWLRRDEFIRQSPLGIMPVMNISDQAIAGINVIIEYLVDNYDNFNFFASGNIERAKIREILQWFNEKFYRDVTKIILDEKMIKLLMKAGAPNSSMLKAAKYNQAKHLSLLENILKDKDFLVTENITVADFAASAHISVLDYFGEIAWNLYPNIKNWYLLIKSRPAFRGILQDTLAGLPPSKYYHLLDY